MGKTTHIKKIKPPKSVKGVVAGMDPIFPPTGGGCIPIK